MGLRNFLNDRAMAQTVSLVPVTLEARVRVRFSPCGICCGRSGTGTGFSQSSVFLLLVIIQPLFR
jgi:hypothetical protein